MTKFNLKSLIKAFVKMDVAIFIFIFLTIGSIIGTIIPQNRTLEQYQDQYGLLWGEIINLLDFDRAYFSAWYLFFLVLLIFSLVACLLINGKVIYKQIFKPIAIDNKKDLEKAEKLEFSSLKDAQKHLKTEKFKLEDNKNYKSIKLEKNNIVSVYFKYKVTHKIGYFATHIGVLGLCIAGIVNGFFGFRADVDLIEGTQTSKAIIYKSDDERYLVKLPFTIRNEEFSIDRYSSNIVKEFTSKVKILDKDTNQVLATHNLKVNSPLFINNFGLYQSSYYENVNNIQFDAFNLKTSSLKSYQAKIDEPVDLNFNDYKITINTFNKNTMLPNAESTKYKEQDFGYSVDYTITDSLGETSVFRTYKDHPDLLGVGFLDENGQLIFKTIPVGIENSNQQMLNLFAGMLNKNNHSKFKQDIAKFVKTLTPEDKKEYLSKLIHALEIYNQLNINFIIRLTSIDYDQVSGIQVNYDPSANIFFASSIALCLGVIFMLYMRLKKAYIIKKDDKIFVYYI
ncbi:MAG: Cytochrome c biogenesis protein Ccs1 [Proteobacteria bacterium]|nr:MAG: Cytochrome c biogenesis protein Ccs1 [Pseudomonadota bacterium]